MKFRNPETGEVFDSLREASDKFCSGHDCFWNKCPLDKANESRACWDWIQEYPIEAARLMGYEVVEDDHFRETTKMEETIKTVPGHKPLTTEQQKDMAEFIDSKLAEKEEANMDKPRICELLGVEVDEEFDYKCEEKRDNGGPWKITKDGKRMYRDSAGSWNWCFNEDMLLELINHPDRIIRKPRFTEQEVEDAKAIRRILGKDWTSVEKEEDGLPPILITYNTGDDEILRQCLRLNKNMFPSVKTGQVVKLDEIIGGAE